MAIGDPTRAGLLQFSMPFIATVLLTAIALIVFPQRTETEILYLWSDGMPLSKEAIPEIEEAAESLGISVRIRRADWLAGRNAAFYQRVSTFGATSHFPSVMLLVQGKPVGSAILGFKTAETYRNLLQTKLTDEVYGGRGLNGEGSGLFDRIGLRSIWQRASVDSSIAMVWERPVRPKPGFFFRKAAGSPFISYDQNGTVMLHEMEKNHSVKGPGFVDFVPTPDGKLFVTPSRTEGLQFYSASKVYQAAGVGSADTVSPSYSDPEMDDQYPSVGIVTDRPNGETIYRVLVSWSRGVAVRDYRVRWSAGERIESIEAVSQRSSPCPNRSLSTPMLSPDGEEIAARDEVSGTSKIFRLGASMNCVPVLNLGIATSKISFSPTRRSFAFSVQDTLSPMSSVFVYYRDHDLVIRLMESESRGLVIPAFVGKDSILHLVHDNLNRVEPEFRIQCCV